MLYTQDSGLRTGYSRPIRRETKFLKEKADTASVRRNVSGFTIDKIDSPDLEDGVWIEKIKNAFRLQISISDVSELIVRETKLYEEAKERCTSLYFNTHIFHMFPHEIATDMASLNHHTTRKSLTLELILDEEGGVRNIELFESLFFNKKRFGYRQTNESMTSSREEFFNELNLLADLAKILYKRRGDSGFLPSLDSQRTINIGERNLFEKRSSNIASFIIQECMILANIEIAKYMIAHKINGIFRNHHFEKGETTSFGKATYS